jgi:hypothetical protein
VTGVATGCTCGGRREAEVRWDGRGNHPPVTTGATRGETGRAR